MARKRALIGQHLVEHGAEAPDIAARRERLASQLLRTHEPRRSYERTVDRLGERDAGDGFLVDGDEIALTPAEFKLLTALARAPGRVFSREALASRAFGDDFVALDRTVDAHIMNLRRKIERDRRTPVFVETVFGQGYRFGGVRA